MNTTCKHSLILTKVTQVHSYIIQFLNRKFSLVLWKYLKANLLFFYFDITNILIIFMPIQYIEVFDLTNPRFYEPSI